MITKEATLPQATDMNSRAGVCCLGFESSILHPAFCPLLLILFIYSASAQQQ